METINLKVVAKNLNIISWQLLDELDKHSQMSISAFRKSLNMSQDKIVRELARLEGAVLIAGERGPIDQRVVLYKLTEYGHTILNYRP